MEQRDNTAVTITVNLGCKCIYNYVLHVFPGQDVRRLGQNLPRILRSLDILAHPSHTSLAPSFFSPSKNVILSPLITYLKPKRRDDGYRGNKN